jgi:hypothetical protein
VVARIGKDTMAGLLSLTALLVTASLAAPALGAQCGHASYCPPARLAAVRLSAPFTMRGAAVSAGLIQARRSRSQAAGTQHPAPDSTAPIQDNSFLIEESYNQESGVVQHINAFARFRESEAWVYTFTQEWPLASQRHQLSFSIPFQTAGEEFDGTGLGDVAVNYRYQLVSGEASAAAVAPRVSVVLPTGDAREARGAGAAGVQVNLPVSVTLSEHFVTHLNAGASYTPSAESALGEEADIVAYNLGQSLIWLARPSFNVMLELAWTSTEEPTGPDRTARGTTCFIAPGVRGAFNFASGLQIVPGLAFPIGLGDSEGETAVFAYLSFEHPFGRRAK